MVAQLIRLSRGWPVAFQRACAQVGWDPRSAVLVRTPAGLSADALAALLRAMQSRIAMKELLSRAVKMGLADSAPMVDVVDQLVVANVVKSHPRQDRGLALKIRVHGSGPLSDVVVSALRCSGARVRHTSQRGATGAADLVVLTNNLAVDPVLVRELHDAATPHLLVRVRDGTGLVGPIPCSRHIFHASTGTVSATS